MLGYGCGSWTNRHRVILDIRISFERTILVAEKFIKERFDKEIWKISTFNRHGGTWYSQACSFVKMKHHLHSSYEKSFIERTIQYIKDRTECFDDYFPCKKEKCKLQHTSVIGSIYLLTIIIRKWWRLK